MAPRYCTVQNVVDEFKSLSTGSGSAVDTTKITRFIEEADEEIDGRLASRYSTPIDVSSATKTGNILRPICIALVKDRISELLQISSNSDANQKAATGVMSAREARMRLKDIQDGKIHLLDATLLSSRDGVADFNTDCDAVGESFKRGEDQW